MFNSLLVLHEFYGLHRVSKPRLIGQMRPAICFANSAALKCVDASLGQSVAAARDRLGL